MWSRKLTVVCVLASLIGGLLILGAKITSTKSANSSITIGVNTNTSEDMYEDSDTSDEDTEEEDTVMSGVNNGLLSSNPKYDLYSEIDNSPVLELGDKAVIIGLGSEETNPKDIKLSIDSYRGIGKILVPTGEVVSFIDKDEYGQTLAVVKLANSDSLKGTVDYNNGNILVLFGCTDNVELTRQLHKGDLIDISAVSSNIISSSIDIDGVSMGNELVIYGEYTKQ